MSDIIKFKDYLHQNNSVFKTEELDNWDELEQISSKLVKKSDYLFRQGDVCTKLFFVESGLLRYFSIDDKGKEHILNFAPEGWIIVDRDSLYFNQPSNYNLQALEDSQIVEFDTHLFSSIIAQSCTLVNFNDRLLHNHIKQLQKRITMLLSAAAEERYLEFTKTYPKIINRVPQWMIASYLGITPESLSRVRKELVLKERSH